MSSKILIADDDEDVLSALTMLLDTEGYASVTARSPGQILKLLHEHEFSLILMDLNYSMDTTSGEEGLSVIGAVRRIDELIPIVVMTGWGTIDLAVQSMKNGANDFIHKPWENDRLVTIIRNQISLFDSQRQTLRLKQQNELLQNESSPIHNIVAHSQSTKHAIEMVRKVAGSDASVLFTGESGTGKSMFAHLLHDLSARRHQPYVSVNMGAIPEALFESEMFGHVKGAFTDAAATRIGRFEMADTGTLFLDEIANIPLSQQGKLLRVLESSQYEKVGSSKTEVVDIRLITATNADLKAAVTAGTFRSDLLYRINAIEIWVPPLRERKDDIVPLAHLFLNRDPGLRPESAFNLDASAESALLSYHWPGNIRELSHVMQRARILCAGSTIHPHHLGLPTGSERVNAKSAVSDRDMPSIGEIEARAIEQRLAAFDGDATQAAQSLGLSRSALYRRLKKLRNQ